METSNLTPEIEERFDQIYQALDAAVGGEDIGPLIIQDLVKDLEARVDRVLESQMCPGCLAAYDQAARDYSEELTFAHLVSVGLG